MAVLLVCEYYDLNIALKAQMLILNRNRYSATEKYIVYTVTFKYKTKKYEYKIIYNEEKSYVCEVVR
jgi:hypothetical protein